MNDKIPQPGNEPDPSRLNGEVTDDTMRQLFDLVKEKCEDEHARGLEISPTESSKVVDVVFEDGRKAELSWHGDPNDEDEPFEMAYIDVMTEGNETHEIVASYAVSRHQGKFTAKKSSDYHDLEEEALTLERAQIGVANSTKSDEEVSVFTAELARRILDHPDYHMLEKERAMGMSEVSEQEAQDLISSISTADFKA